MPLPAAGNAATACFELALRVYWEDTDAGGIVFYANYLKFMERARTEWLRSLGIHQRALRESSGGMFVVSESQLKYHRPARLDDSLCVSARLEHLGTASLVVAQQVHLQDPHNADARTLLCDGSIRIGWVDAERMRPTRIPTQIAGTLSASHSSMGQSNRPGLSQQQR